MMMGAGMAMMLPQVANAVAVTESEVTVKTPDGTADCYFVHPDDRHGSRRARVARHFRTAASVPANGQASGRIRAIRCSW